MIRQTALDFPKYRSLQAVAKAIAQIALPQMAIAPQVVLEDVREAKLSPRESHSPSQE